ncbi:MAG: hypothetical protein HY861_04975 [Chlamydiia bacterium]|nr:hypothetical protein [Chlamydiia bacterium]
MATINRILSHGAMGAFVAIASTSLLKTDTVRYNVALIAITSFFTMGFVMYKDAAALEQKIHENVAQIEAVHARLGNAARNRANDARAINGAAQEAEVVLRPIAGPIVSPGIVAAALALPLVAMAKENSGDVLQIALTSLAALSIGMKALPEIFGAKEVLTGAVCGVVSAGFALAPSTSVAAAMGTTVGILSTLVL